MGNFNNFTNSLRETVRCLIIEKIAQGNIKKRSLSNSKRLKEEKFLHAKYAYFYLKTIWMKKSQ
jgi:hypothetical protein